VARDVHRPPTLTPPIEALLSPFLRFARMEAAGGILLLTSTVAALIWANSPWEQIYHSMLNLQVSIGFGRFFLSASQHQWINDGLMSIFFFLAGLEIKREVLIGELSSVKQAAFPLISALGGTLVPALSYVAFNHDSPLRQGWGIPIATDIAFALGVLALLGDRIPLSLKIFVTALAIADDIIAVSVIAVVYSEHIHLLSLAVGLFGLGLSLGANLLGVRRPAVYALIGVCVWCAVLKSGLHATISGVLLAFTIPARTYLDRDDFLESGRCLLDQYALTCPRSSEEHAAISALVAQCEMVESPLHRIEHGLQPWVSFLVMPLFAFANAGVQILGKVTLAAKHPVTLGTALGLFLGKPIGIFLFALCATKAKLTVLPSGISWSQVFGAGWVCGIGFTMSLFMATLAFGDGDVLHMAKIGTLAGSIAAGISGGMFLACKGDDLYRLDPTGKGRQKHGAMEAIR